MSRTAPTDDMPTRIPGIMPLSGTPAPTEAPIGTFFDPTPAFIDFLVSLLPPPEENRKLAFVDIGSGTGYLSARITEAVPNYVGVLPLDIREHDEACIPAIPIDGTRFTYADGMIPILARPCHGAFVGAAIGNALAQIGLCFYVGLTKNFERDLGPIVTPCARFGYLFSRVFSFDEDHPAGAAGEEVIFIYNMRLRGSTALPISDSIIEKVLKHVRTTNANAPDDDDRAGKSVAVRLTPGPPTFEGRPLFPG